MRKNLAFDKSHYDEWRNPKDLIPYAKNAKKHDEKQVKNIANSIKRFGWRQECVITTDNVLVIGHGRRLAALKIGCECPVHIIDKTADELTDDDIRELRLADNLTNESEWDFDIRDEEMADLDFEGFDFDFGLDDLGEEEEQSKYTMAVNIPQYEITGEQPNIADMLDTTKADSLISEIEEAEGITDEERDFLIEAAKRHNTFNYRNIAEYYAHATPEMQELMEKSALVIIDVDNAIANGYVRVSDDIMAMMEDENDGE